jgi:hypothetical protein
MYDTAQNYRIPHKVVQRLSQHNLKISNQLHTEVAPSKKIKIQYSLWLCPWPFNVRNFIFLIAAVNDFFHHRKKNVNFDFQPPAMLAFLFFFSFAKVVSLKVVHPLKICQLAKCHGTALTGANFASPSAVSKSHHCHFKMVHQREKYSGKSCRYVHDLSLHQTSFISVQQFMSCFHKTKC